MTSQFPQIRHNFPAVLSAAVFLFACTSFDSAAQTTLTWHWSNPAPHGNNIADMAQRNGLYIQVTDRGQIYTSEDFQTWVPRQSHTARALRAVTFFGNRIVAVGENGTIVYADSVEQWIPVSLNTTDWLEGVAASASRLVAVGDDGAVYTSFEGANWQRQSIGSGPWLRSVAFGTPQGTELFVAVGENGFVAISNDGANWQVVPPLTSEPLNKVFWGNEQFFAVGEGGVVFTSLDGKNWLNANIGATNALYAVATNPSSVLLAGDSEVRLKDGRAWADQFAASIAFPPPRWTYLSALWDNTSFVLGGRTGLIVEGFKTNATSPTFWLPWDDSPREWIWDMKRIADLYLAVGDRATILTSIDGRKWSQELPALTNAVFLGVGGSTNLAVAVGSGGAIMVSPNVLEPVISTNASGTLVTNEVSSLGIFWYAVAKPVTNDLQGVTFFNDSFVVSGGAGTILTSFDGTNWTKRATPTSSFLSSVESFPGGVVAVGKSGAILTSQDAVNWTAGTAQTANWIYRVRYLGGNLIAVGQNGLILTSSDGTQWVPQNSGTVAWLNDVQMVNGNFFVVGNQGTVLTSADLVTWNDVGTITGKSLFCAATANGRLVLAGVEGVILRSQISPFTTPVGILRYPTQAAENVFLFTGEPDQRFRLDRSNDLPEWHDGPVLEIADSSGTLIYLDSMTNNPSLQFFRAVPGP